MPGIRSAGCAANPSAYYGLLFRLVRLVRLVRSGYLIPPNYRKGTRIERHWRSYARVRRVHQIEPANRQSLASRCGAVVPQKRACTGRK